MEINKIDLKNTVKSKDLCTEELLQYFFYYYYHFFFGGGGLGRYFIYLIFNFISKLVVFITLAFHLPRLSTHLLFQKQKSIITLET